jgi:hypothetical protein
VKTPANDPIFAFCLLSNTRNIAERNHLNSKASHHSRAPHHSLRRTSSDFSPPPVKSASNEKSLPVMSLYDKLPVAASLCIDLLALSVSLLLLAKREQNSYFDCTTNQKCSLTPGRQTHT